jgi:hypothetical protein
MCRRPELGKNWTKKSVFVKMTTYRMSRVVLLVSINPAILAAKTISSACFGELEDSHF